MIICVGSTNAVKVEAVRETVFQYDFLRQAEVRSAAAKSEVADQPKSLEETIRGAMNRAKNAFHKCDYSIGIESGVMEVPHSKTGYMDVAVCAIFDGQEYYLGLSSAFEYPKEVTRLVLEEGLDINQAFLRVGLSPNPKLGSFEGAIGILTKGKMPRKDLTKQSVVTALVRLENKELFL